MQISQKDLLYNNLAEEKRAEGLSMRDIIDRLTQENQLLKDDFRILKQKMDREKTELDSYRRGGQTRDTV